MTSHRVLLALSRFTSASCAELVEALGLSGNASTQAVWRRLKQHVAAGNVERAGMTYRVTETGKRAAAA